jgi:hypothetical protein
MPNSERNAQHLEKRIHLTGKFSGERPSIANPTERAMVNEGVEVIVCENSAENAPCGLATASCSLLFHFGLLIIKGNY